MQPKTKNAVFRCCWSSSLVYKVDSVGCGGVMSLSILCLVRHHHYEHNNAQTKIFSYPAPRVEPTMRASRDLGSDPFRSFGLYLVDLDPTANAGCAWPPLEAAMELYTRLPSALAEPARTPREWPQSTKSALLDSLQKLFRRK